MTIRSFIDASGQPWDVWEVHTNVVDRRRVADRRAVKRSTEERRVGELVAWLAARRKANAWLVFRSALGRWRLAPVPDDWATMSDAGLYQLISRGVRAKDQRVVPAPSKSLEVRQ